MLDKMFKQESLVRPNFFFQNFKRCCWVDPRFFKDGLSSSLTRIKKTKKNSTSVALTPDSLHNHRTRARSILLFFCKRLPKGLRRSHPSSSVFFFIFSLTRSFASRAGASKTCTRQHGTPHPSRTSSHARRRVTLPLQREWTLLLKLKNHSL